MLPRVTTTHLYTHLYDFQVLGSGEGNQSKNHELIPKYQIRPFGHAGNVMDSKDVLSKVDNYYTLPLSMLVCLLLYFTLKILFQKFYSFGGLEGINCTDYIRGF